MRSWQPCQTISMKRSIHSWTKWSLARSPSTQSLEIEWLYMKKWSIVRWWRDHASKICFNLWRPEQISSLASWLNQILWVEKTFRFSLIMKLPNQLSMCQDGLYLCIFSVQYSCLEHLPITICSPALEMNVSSSWGSSIMPEFASWLWDHQLHHSTMDLCAKKAGVGD